MPKGKKKRASYQCSEFADSLLRVFTINIGNDIPDIHPESFCYSCKQVMERSRTHYSSTAIVQWDKHVEEACKVPLTSHHMYVLHAYFTGVSSQKRCQDNTST